MTPTRLIVSRPTPLVGTRRSFSTFQAMQAIIESARSSLILVFYAITESARPLVDSIAARARDGVRVTFCFDDRYWSLIDACSSLARGYALSTNPSA